MFQEKIKNDFNIALTERQMSQFKEYFEFLVLYNKTTNLTSITIEHEVYYKHFYDSLTLLRNVDMTKVNSFCDIGAGAGFPSIPIKIVFPHLEITIIDSLGKRITFLKELISRLKLDKVYLHHSRAEDFALKNQNVFDLVTARAVANMRIITELAIPMTKVSGHFIALKGSNYEDELLDARTTIDQLQSKTVEIDQFNLPLDYGARTNIKVLKIRHVKGYPRSYAQILKKGL